MSQFINPIIKSLPEDISNFKIIGSGHFSVCIQLESLHPLTTKKTVRIISSQRSEEDMKLISEKKALLKKQKVNVAESSNIVSIPMLQNPINKELRERLQRNEFHLNEQYTGRYTIMYDEEYMPGKTLKVKSLADFALLEDIPQQHITKMISDMMAIYDAGLDIDNAGDNLLYDQKTGFNFIDLDLTPYIMEKLPLNSCFEEITHHLSAFLGVSVMQGIAFKQQLENNNYIQEEVEGYIRLAQKCVIGIQHLEQQYPQLATNKKYTGWLNGMKKFTEDLQDLLDMMNTEDTI